MKQTQFINTPYRDILDYGMLLKLLVLLLILKLRMRFMTILHKEQHLSMLGLVQRLKVLVVLQRIMLDGKYFGVLMFKLREELIILQQQL
jgi:hypothetical protein